MVSKLLTGSLRDSKRDAPFHHLNAGQFCILRDGRQLYLCVTTCWRRYFVTRHPGDMIDSCPAHPLLARSRLRAATQWNLPSLPSPFFRSRTSGGPGEEEGATTDGRTDGRTSSDRETAEPRSPESTSRVPERNASTGRRRETIPPCAKKTSLRAAIFPPRRLQSVPPAPAIRLRPPRPSDVCLPVTRPGVTGQPLSASLPPPPSVLPPGRT